MPMFSKSKRVQLKTFPAGGRAKARATRTVAQGSFSSPAALPPRPGFGGAAAGKRSPRFPPEPRKSELSYVRPSKTQRRWKNRRAGPRALLHPRVGEQGTACRGQMTGNRNKGESTGGREEDRRFRLRIVMSFGRDNLLHPPSLPRRREPIFPRPASAKTCKRGSPARERRTLRTGTDLK